MPHEKVGTPPPNVDKSFRDKATKLSGKMYHESLNPRKAKKSSTSASTTKKK